MPTRTDPNSSERHRLAARRLVNARRAGVALKEMLPDCKPDSMQDALKIQDLATELLEQKVRGWKVFTPPGGELARGGILESVFFEDGARFAAELAPFLGVEAEIAFRLEADLPKRSTPYSREDVAPLVSACPAIEFIHSRYIDFNAVSLHERVADHFLNGGFAQGTTVRDWKSLDLANARLKLEIDGIPVIEAIGGHPAGDPVLPVVDLANHFRADRGLKAGEIITTGSFSGLTCAKPGQTIRATFEGLGSVTVHIGRS
jgi:2-keto-4-pentenoate hydratase